MNLKNIAYLLISAIAIIFILNIGSSLIIPFVFAVLLWFVVRQLRVLADKIPIFKKHIPLWLKNLIVLAFLFFIAEFVISIVINNVNSLAGSYVKYEENARMLLNQVNHTLNINLVDKFKEFLDDFNIGNFLISVFKFSTDIISTIFIVLLYSLFIFMEETSFKSKLKKMFQDESSYNSTVGFIVDIEQSIGKYLGVKTLTSVSTGVLSYIVLLIIGIDYPAFWAFLIFILNYIPAIGSTIATLFPALFSLLQYGEFMPGIMVLIFVGALQVIIGNIIEPKLMGSSMNISPLVTIISLSFWGAIWGITGMVLSVPIMVIIVIILAKFQETRPIAIMLSDKGIVEQ